MLIACAGDGDRELRVHALKTLVDRHDLASPLRALAVARLKDDDPFVRRAAAEVLGAHPALAGIRPLLAIRQSTAPDDTYLIHVVRMALRDQLESPEVWSKLDTLNLSERDRRDIADVATGVHSLQAAAFLLAHLKRSDEPQGNFASVRPPYRSLRCPRFDSRAGTSGRIREAAASERLELLKAIQQGAQERGAALDEPTRRVAAGLASQLLGSTQAGDVALGIDVVRDFQFKEMQPALKKVIQRHDLSDQPRMHAMGALTVIDPRRI